MEITIDNCHIYIDESATRDFYKRYGTVNNCDCSGCRNFRYYVPGFSDTIRSFFKNIGIDNMQMITEIIPMAALENGLLFYGGFYHAVGKIYGGNEIASSVPVIEPIKDSPGNIIGFSKTGEKHRKIIRSESMKIDDMFSISFNNDCDLLEDNFPESALQIEIETYIPWIIDEDNTYQERLFSLQ